MSYNYNIIKKDIKQRKGGSLMKVKVKEMGVSMNEVYDFIKNHKEAKKDCNDLLASGMDFDEASVLAYSSWR